MITAAVAALLVLPLVVLRRRTLWTYYATDLATWLFAWIVWRRVSADVDPYLAFVALAVLKLATFSLFLANGRDVRWSANRAALLAAIVYAVAIPAMLRTPIDGDEPFYLLVTESLVHDGDLDLANQYRAPDRSAAGRTDLRPQLGDPTGPRGEQYSRTEVFLSLLLVPGYLIAGLHGALAIIALFGALLVRSTVRWMEDEGISESAARAVFPFFAFGPPVLFYATRLWPEVPAAFCYVEALRGVRNRRAQRWVPALLGLVLLKLRFLLVAVGLLALAARSARKRSARLQPGVGGLKPAATLLAVIVAIIAVPLFISYFITGDPTNVHSWRELIPDSPAAYARGFAGLLADGMSGIAFRAPFYLLALFALTRWRHTPRGFRDGILAALLYILYLLPRMEWFGGWAPPLRYLVFVMPVLALGAAAVWDRISRGAIALVAAWTTALVIHGLAYPWRLFHIANGENAIGEWLSRLYRADFSRLFPSFIRMNDAAWIGAAAVVAIIAFGLRRQGRRFGSGGEAAVIALFALALALGFTHARKPADRVHFEDAHVAHEGGDLWPEEYRVMRVAYTGGWVMEAGDSMSFLAREGKWTLHAISGPGAMIELAGRAYQIPSNVRYVTTRVVVPQAGRVTLRCLAGSVNVDRMVAEQRPDGPR
ncbi:MAG TPA: hypothetical protein VNA69_12470 [Thermoanaerobaculia bacterium]|nr:hypothetical protein [Thermoanaerobaculia bacterium]